MDMVRTLDKIADTLQAIVNPARDDIVTARETFANVRAAHGFKNVATPLLTAPDGNYKLDKSVTPTYGLALAQADTSGHNVCRYSTPGCRSVCVAQNGNGEFDTVKRARIARTVFLAEHPEQFVTLLVAELAKINRKHDGNVAVRLNTFSDIPWERYLNAAVFGWATFYDYTKWSRDVRPMPTGYSLVRSITERDTNDDIIDIVNAGETPVVVFDAKRHALPTEWHGVPVVDGDVTDERFNDTGVIVGLAAKGRLTLMRQSGFARAV